jgi:hypothetical protein
MATPPVSILDMINSAKKVIATSVKYITHLKRLASTDAYHDFKTLKVDLDTVIPSLSDGLPGTNGFNDHYKESAALDSLLQPSSRGREAFKQFIYDTSHDCTTGSNGKSRLDIYFDTEQLFTYNVCSVNKQCENTRLASPAFTDTIKDDEFAEKFVKNVNLGGDHPYCGFVLDFGQHHFLEDLAKGPTSVEKNNDPYQIYYLLTPECVNDPAGKPNVNNTTYFKTDVKPNGVKLIPYVQTGHETMNYTAYDENNSTYNNNFISKYNYELSPIKSSYQSKKEKYIVDLNISYTDKNDKPFFAAIKDSKDENSVKTIEKYLRSIIGMLIKPTTKNPENIFKLNCKVQQKRGGDWFQVLCCHDVRNRTYTNMLDPDRKNLASLPTDCPIYFVTHDQVAVAYALSIGVNVITWIFTEKRLFLKTKKIQLWRPPELM